MENIPLEVIVRHACRSIGNFFAEQAEKERMGGKVAILVEDFTNSVYYMPCDKHGYPDFHTLRYVTYDSLNLTAISTSGANPMPCMQTMNIEEVSIMIEKPLLTQRYDWQDKPYVFMWSGKRISSRKIPLEKLNVSELMKLAQQAIINREGLVIDEAIKNKIYK
jgi:hypothetical protein